MNPTESYNIFKDFLEVSKMVSEIVAANVDDAIEDNTELIDYEYEPRDVVDEDIQ